MTNSNAHTHKWSILFVVTLVSFITNLDSTIVVVGLPKIMEGLNINVVSGLWIITSYIIASTVLILPAGKWADIIGMKRIFILGLTIFAIGTVLCGIANSGFALIIYRVIQGAGAALASATATPTIIKAFPEEQLGLALGINATSWVIGAIIGPVAGGVLVGRLGWRSLFFVTVPFVIICIIGAFIVIKDIGIKASKVKVDKTGILTFGLGLIAVMIVLSEGQSWGWLSFSTISLISVALILWIIFIFVELRNENPLFNLALFRYKNYTVGLGITLCYCIAYFSIPLLLTIYLQSVLHLSPSYSGLLMIPLSVPQLVMGPIGGKLADYFGAMKMVAFGLIFLIVGLFYLGFVGSTLSILSIVLPLTIMSIANSLAWPALAKTVLSAAPKEQAGSASGMYYTLINVGKALSQTLAVILIEVSVPTEIVSKAIAGIGETKNIHVGENMVRSIDSAFRFFIAFFMIALILGFYLLRSNAKKRVVTCAQFNA